jgi:lambda repressor-like predicted transcriptional regulator
MPQKPTPLKRIMLDEGRRQSWLASTIGKDQSEVSRIVNRGLVPDEEIRLAIASALGREPSELWPELHQKDAAPPADSERSAA